MNYLERLQIEEMRKMNYEVNVNGKSSEEVAKQILQKRSYFVNFTINIQFYMYERNDRSLQNERFFCAYLYIFSKKYSIFLHFLLE